MALGTRSLQANTDYSIPVTDILDEVSPKIYSPHSNSFKELHMVKLAPQNLNTTNFAIDIQPDAEGMIRIQAQKTPKELYYLVKITGYMAVINGAPGANGPVLNHFNESAIQNYFERMSKRLTEKLGNFGNYFRAFLQIVLNLKGLIGMKIFQKFLRNVSVMTSKNTCRFCSLRSGIWEIPCKRIMERNFQMNFRRRLTGFAMILKP